MLNNASFNYDQIQYVHQCNNLTIEIVRKGVTPDPEPDFDPLLKKEVSTHKIKGNAQCGISSFVMLCNYWLKLEGKSPISTPQAIKSLYSTYDNDLLQDKTRFSVFEVQYNYPSLFLQLLSNKGVSNAYSKYEGVSRLNFTVNEILDALDNYGPVITNGKFTNDGHYILLKGWSKEEQSFIVHDPYYEYDFKKDSYLTGSKKTGQDKLYPYTFVEKKSNESTGHKGMRGAYIKLKT